MKFYSTERKLGFQDVSIIPTSDLVGPQSRKDVDLSGQWVQLSGLPVIVANMDAVGTFSMAKAVCPQSLFVCLHKHYTFPQLKNFLSSNHEIEDKIYLSCGLYDKAWYNIVGLSNEFTKFNIRLDVPNGHLKSFVEFSKYVRDLFPERFIAAGNVGSPEGVENLAKTGVDAVITGIANGCFIKGTLVSTRNGLKKIENIQPGEEVKTHDGTYQKVKQTFKRVENQRIMDINGIKCTSNHKFYVIHKDDSNKITDENIHTYARWVSAEELSEDYFQIKLTE